MYPPIEQTIGPGLFVYQLCVTAMYAFLVPLAGQLGVLRPVHNPESLRLPA